MWAHVHQPPPALLDVRPELPRELGDVLSRAMAKDPAHRRRPQEGSAGRRSPRSAACRSHLRRRPACGRRQGPIGPARRVLRAGASDLGFGGLRRDDAGQSTAGPARMPAAGAGRTLRASPLSERGVRCRKSPWVLISSSSNRSASGSEENRRTRCLPAPSSGPRTCAATVVLDAHRAPLTWGTGGAPAVPQVVRGRCHECSPPELLNAFGKGESPAERGFREMRRRGLEPPPS